MTTPPPPPRDQVAVLILDRAAALLAEPGTAAGMTDIARAAGVGRATLYRYYPSRQALLDALADAAVDDLGDRLEAAGLAHLPVRDAIARVCHAFVTTGAKYIALRHTGHKPADPTATDRRIGTPLRALVRRGITDGTLRGDQEPDITLTFFAALLEAGLTLTPHLGPARAAATVTTQFLDGASPRRRS
ncbi:TetR/AcrR family transcriptional regulator [Kitasatospora viridis]|uniref:TetR family transcriptional regulator n=1 Tax=Kitasatospora viridis TaxID=281105 RepID=A0A561UC83_9ACTN|nr:TetR/AcrR family transcriptional regulator [Kitasatospora viridis]TWF96956.1 TetR family transcriptional regulator [Kitasatospora viridis]